MGDRAGRRGLQVLVAVLACVPVGTGLLDVLGGVAVLPGPPPSTSPDLESNYRFFATVWCGVGLTLAWTVPRVERAGAVLRAIGGAIFVGGLVRLLAAALHGLPHPIFVTAAAVELAAPPLVVWWQAQVARATRAAPAMPIGGPGRP
ncbi:hypothetical protein GCM10010124_06400 [Pilimelia terevasa]|uniref:DUF4345 domain-containing protein n=1 Tax=Pilimelia terevasa TaxID=53372 RepID=A0A8J3BI71_9ACTN|nr:DUF4345 domain-containing protein [Pilimelia terevasa]GGK16531.1 hypothetical protein GCM10010124_06400 [Pilimelia terevasa]